MCHKSRAWPIEHKGGRKAWQKVPLTWMNGKAGFTGLGWLVQLRVASRYSLFSGRSCIFKLGSAVLITYRIMTNIYVVVLPLTTLQSSDMSSMILTIDLPSCHLIYVTSLRSLDAFSDKCPQKSLSRYVKEVKGSLVPLVAP